jgi:hypothetical protein
MCRQVLDAGKIKSTQKEQLESMETSETATGFCVLTMKDGVQHRVPHQKMLALLSKAQRSMGANGGPLPAWVYARYPALGWFKDCVEAKSDDGSRIHEVALAFVRGPVAGPNDPPFDLDNQHEQKAS